MLVYGFGERVEKSHSSALTKETPNYSVSIFVAYLGVLKGKVNWVKSQYMDFKWNYLTIL